MCVKLTKSLIYAAGHDAAERSRRARGLTTWDEVAYAAACAEIERLIAAIGIEAWIALD
jgi:hypothetical protein